MNNIQKCEQYLSEALNTTVLLTPSCTSALEMSALLLDIQPGDEVILPSFTFPSTANAFMLRGAIPIFCDIKEDTLNIDENLIPQLITNKTKAIVPIHYAGVAASLHSIMYDSPNVPVIEDNAHGLFGTYRGDQLGTIGEFGTLSFHYTKNFSCGEGGALLINDPEYIDRAKCIQNKGTNRHLFERGEVDKYIWVALGSSYTIADSLAEILLKQFRDPTNYIQSKRGELFWLYHTKLKQWAKEGGVILPTIPENTTPAYHIFWMLLPTIQDRVSLQAYLAKHNIKATTHYQPLHLSPMNPNKSHCPITESVAGRLLRLPLHHTLEFDEQERIIKVILDYTD